MWYLCKTYKETVIYDRGTNLQFQSMQSSATKTSVKLRLTWFHRDLRQSSDRFSLIEPVSLELIEPDLTRRFPRSGPRHREFHHRIDEPVREPAPRFSKKKGKSSVCTCRKIARETIFGNSGRDGYK